MVRLINEMTLLKLSFGSFLRNFGMLKFDTLSSTKTLPEILKVKEYDIYYGNICDFLLQPKEKKMHEYFTNLSKAIGFNESEAISLYDLPG